MKPRCLGLLGPLLLLVVACGNSEGAGLSPGGSASNEYWFDSLPQMVATSDIVVLGTVVDLHEGITEGEPPEEIQLLRADVDVTETLYGDGLPSELTIETLQFVAPQPDWRQVGNTVLAFMKLSTEPDAPGIYYPVNDQSVYLVEGRDVQETVEDDPFSASLANMTIDQLRREIQEAVDAVASGDVTVSPTPSR